MGGESKEGDKFAKDVTLEISGDQTLFDIIKKLAETLDAEIFNGKLRFEAERRYDSYVKDFLPSFVLESSGNLKTDKADRLYLSLCEENNIEPAYFPNGWDPAKDHPEEYCNNLFVKLKDFIEISEGLDNSQISLESLSDKIINGERIKDKCMDDIANIFVKLINEKMPELVGVKAESVNDLIDEINVDGDVTNRNEPALEQMENESEQTQGDEGR